MPPERLVLFVSRSDPHGRERLGAFLADGRLVDLQAGHMAMRGVPSPFLRDRTSFTLGGAPATLATEEVMRWVASQEPPGVLVPERNVRITEPLRP